MSEDRIPLDWRQVAAMDQAMHARADTIISQVLQQPDYPPLPACPECEAVPDRISSTVEPSKFDVDEDVVLINITPCGHRFRAVFDIEAHT